MSIPGSASPLLLTSAVGAAGADAKSLRFNSGDSAYLNRTPSSAGNRKTWTFSCWIKGTGDFNSQNILSTTGTTDADFAHIYFNGGDLLTFGTATATILRTNATFRDPSAWFHIVVAFDSTQATAANRVKFYINGVEQDSFQTDQRSSITQNADYGINSTQTHALGRQNQSGYGYLNGYLTDVIMVDGQQLSPTDFGEFDATTGVWNPIAYSGSYPGNSFHLDFSDNSSASALGTDSSGNGNDWTVNNISAPVADITLRPRSSTTWTATGGMSTFSYFQSPANKTDSDFGYSPTLNWNTSASTTGGTMQIDFATVIATAGDVVDVFQGNPSFETPKLILDNSANLTPDSSTTSSSTNQKYSTFTIPAGRTCSIVHTTTTSGARSSFFGVMVNGVSILTDDPNVNNDSLFDSPTNGTQTDTGAGGEVSGNYAVWSPISKYSTAPSPTNGNLTIPADTGYKGTYLATVALPKSGKYYWEVSSPGSSWSNIIAGVSDNVSQYYPSGGSGNELGVYFYATNLIVGTGNITAASSPTFTLGETGVTYGFAADMDTGNLYLYRATIAQNSGNPIATGLNTVTTPLFPSTNSHTKQQDWNFGQRPFVAGPGTGGAAPSGFKALCTANLDDPTIADGSTAMDIALYTGNGSTQTISGLGFSPDLVWIKERSSTSSHQLYDTIRGATNTLYSNLTNEEQVNASALTSFTSTGFNVGASNGVNQSAQTYVAWTWDGGTGSPVSNTNGTITSSVRANPNAGFSIVSYTGNGTSGSTIGHGLGVAPSLFIIKNRTSSSNWPVFYTFGDGSLDILQLAATDAKTDSGQSLPSSTVFTVGGNIDVNASGSNYIAYCWAPVEGYSAFGSYTGTGLSDGPFVYTGMRPRWIMVKASDYTTDWAIIDTARETYNVTDSTLDANNSTSESTSSNNYVDVLSNGFKLRTSTHPFNAGYTYIYAAFAETPQKFSRAR